MLYFYYIDYPDTVKMEDYQKVDKIFLYLLEDLKGNPDVTLGQIFQSRNTFEASIISQKAVKISDIDFTVKDVFCQYDESNIPRAWVLDINYIESGPLYDKIQPYLYQCSIIPAVDTKENRVICFGVILPPYSRM